MNRIATVSVIRGSGACDVYMNHVVSQEMKRLQALERKENEGLRQRMELVTSSRNKLLDERLKQHDRESSFRKPFHKRLQERLVQAYSVFFALCLEFGFIEYIGDDDTWRIK